MKGAQVEKVDELAISGLREFMWLHVKSESSLCDARMRQAMEFVGKTADELARARWYLQGRLDGGIENQLMRKQGEALLNAVFDRAIRVARRCEKEGLERDA